MTLVLLSVMAPSVLADFKSTGNSKFDAAVRRGVEFLEGRERIAEKEETLVAYALLKAGVPKSEGHVRNGIAAARERATTGAYSTVGYDHLYYAGVDALLLSAVDKEANFQALQEIADYVASVQRPDGSFADNQKAAGDTSMAQYALLALWSGKVAGCRIQPRVLDRCAEWHLKNMNPDGGWAYRPGQSIGDGKGRSTPTMSIAASGSLGIVRNMLFGSKLEKKEKPKAKFGVLSQDDPTDASVKSDGDFPDYSPVLGRGAIEGGIGRALKWNEVRYSPVPNSLSKIYFYYALERGLALNNIATFAGQDWFTAYGNGLLTLQAKDGSWTSFNGQNIATSFAILYFLRTTKLIIEQQYASGLQAGGRLDDLREKKKKKELGPLDELLAQMQDVDFDQLDGIDAEAVAEKIAFGSREELIGQLDLLKKLRKHPDAQNRIAAYFALGRTGDFALVPDILKGLRDPNIDVNVQALDALRYLSRKPNGFGMTLTPFAGAELADDKTRLKIANAWRTKAFKTWGTWYRSVRPFEESGGLDELELRATSKQ